jgi:hypothetical protein
MRTVAISRPARRFRTPAVIAVAAGALAACSDVSTTPDDVAGALRATLTPTVIAASGDITSAVAECRALFGEPANTAVGEQPTGRREISWDGNNPFVNTNDMPPDLFNAVVPRGQVYSTPGNGFRISSNDFSDLNITYADEFNPFSGDKTFAPTGANRMDVHFFVAGTTTRAKTTGMCIVFSDVDTPHSTSMELFAGTGESLGKWFAPVRSDSAGHSLLGIIYPNAVVKRVRIINGGRSIGPEDITDGGKFDRVVMDDFIIGEPRTFQ